MFFMFKFTSVVFPVVLYVPQWFVFTVSDQTLTIKYFKKPKSYSWECLAFENYANYDCKIVASFICITLEKIQEQWWCRMRIDILTLEPVTLRAAGCVYQYMARQTVSFHTSIWQRWDCIICSDWHWSHLALFRNNIVFQMTQDMVFIKLFKLITENGRKNGNYSCKKEPQRVNWFEKLWFRTYK